MFKGYNKLIHKELLQSQTYQGIYSDILYTSMQTENSAYLRTQSSHYVCVVISIVYTY